MKHIQWFPGHMTKAMRMMEESVALVDGVLAVLDARAPVATRNKNLNKLFGNKPVLYLLNKSDLADEKRQMLFWRRLRGRVRRRSPVRLRARVLRRRSRQNCLHF